METDGISAEEKAKIIKRLKERGLTRCPMCHHKNFVIAESYFVNMLQNDLRKLNINGKGIPSIPIICRNCGFISQHSLGVLDFLPKDKPDGK